MWHVTHEMTILANTEFNEYKMCLLNNETEIANGIS